MDQGTGRPSEPIVNPFFNDRERRLRALWRLLLQFLISFAGLVLLESLLSVAFTPSGGGAPATSPVFQVADRVASLVAALLSVWLAGRFFDRRPFSGFGLRLNRDWWLDFGFGLFLGALLMSGIFFTELAAGWVTMIGAFEAVGKGASFFPAILAPVTIFICVGITEELVSRGYWLRNMAEGLNLPGLGPRSAVFLAWVLSSSFFGLLHLANPNASVVSTLNIVFAGLLLGTGYVLTGRLGISIGFHMTWNFFQGSVFDFPVSGTEPVGATFLSIEQGGPPLFTGGAFGPEAGLLGLAAILLGSLFILLWVRARSGKATLHTPLAEPPTCLGSRE